MADTLTSFANTQLADIKARHRHRMAQPTMRQAEHHLTRNNKELISFSCNDYLGLTHHPDVKGAAEDAIRQYGTGAGASRLVTGNHPLYEKVEHQLANLKGTEAACIFGSGYLTNSSVIPALMDKQDLILADKYSHACLVDGAQLSGARMIRFPHNNMDACKRLLEKHRAQYRHCLLITEGVFSMDGDIAPLDELSELAHEYDCWLMVDDAHGVGVLGDGAGTHAMFSPYPQIDIHTGTFSKAIGSYGGYVCGSTPVIDYIRNTARSLIYSTALPPSVLASASKALDIIQHDKDYVAKPLAHARYFTNLLGLPDAESAIVPLIMGEEEQALEASRILYDAGFLVSAIRPPTIPPGTARLRFTFSATHRREDITRLANIIIEHGWHV